MAKLALAAGHHNQTGGNALEKTITGLVTQALAQACRVRGFDVRVITPDEGLGTYPGGLDKVAQTVVNWSNAGWRADIFLEVHGEANGSGNAGRGCFVIYPDWGVDRDIITRDRLGPAIAGAIDAGTGIPRRGSGVLSEKQTQVGLGGHRLGIFAITASLKSFCRRLIVEVGSYTAPFDLSIMQKAGFPERIAAAMASSLGDFVGLPATALLPPGTQAVDPALLSIWKELGGLGRQTTLGWLPGPGYAIGPLRPFPDGNGVMQLCERFIVGKDRGGAPRIPLAVEVKTWNLS